MGGTDGIKGLGYDLLCPRDGRRHCSVVDAVFSVGHSRRATVFLSWVWSYTFEDVRSALSDWSSKNPGDHFLWWCYHCNNQFRMADGQVSASELVVTFGDQLRQVGRMLTLMDDALAPRYATRLWCLFEVFVAERDNIPLQACISERGREALVAMLKTGGARNLVDSGFRINSEEATATMPEDETHIKSLIRLTSSFAAVDDKVTDAIAQNSQALIVEAVQALKHDTSIK